MKRVNIAGRAGRWSADNWKKASFGWIGFVIVAIALGTVVGPKELRDSDTASGEAAVAQRMLERGGFEEPAGEAVLLHSDALTVDNLRYRAAVSAVARTLFQLPQVRDVRTPFGERGTGLVSADEHSALIQFEITGKAEDAKGKVKPILDLIAALDRDYAEMSIRQFGSASATYEVEQTVGRDFQRAELMALPATLIILVVAFGAFVAAGIPVLLAFSAVLASIGLATALSHVIPAADAQASVILLIGMAVGVDYALFYLRREREERANGKSPHDALLTTAATSGQAVLISGITVLIAMAGMLLAGNAIFTGIGAGAMIVVAVAMIGSLSVLPALISKLGDRVEKGHVPLIGRVKRGNQEGRVWGRIIDAALRRPAVSVAVSAGFLLACSLPVLGMHTKLPSFTDLPKDIALVDTYADMQAAFPGAQTPAIVALEGNDVSAFGVRNAVNDLRRRAVASGQMTEPIHIYFSADKTVARVEIPLEGSGDDEVSFAALTTLRQELLPATIGRVRGVDYAVTGLTAGTKDFNDEMKSRAPIVFAFVLGLAFLLLLATFRSIVIPLKSIILNLLSVGAAYGILIMIFQWGHLEGVLGFESNGAIVSWLPLFLFVILFGLSMDYHVFILSRVKELVDHGWKTEDAVARGIKTTAGTVTSAAIVMVAVFAIFATLSTLDLKQMGVGLAVAILLDATVIRGLLLPATMKLLGDWNWYLPKWLEWLPKVSVEAEDVPPIEDGTELRPALTP